MKKTLAMVLALVMMFTLLTGCGGGGGDSGGDGTGAEYTWRMALNGSAPGELGYDRNYGHVLQGEGRGAHIRPRLH